jgi:hypothetical protein
MRRIFSLYRRLPSSIIVPGAKYYTNPCRHFTMASSALKSVNGDNGKTNTWQGVGAAEFDLRSEPKLDSYHTESCFR